MKNIISTLLKVYYVSLLLHIVGVRQLHAMQAPHAEARITVAKQEVTQSLQDVVNALRAAKSQATNVQFDGVKKTFAHGLQLLIEAVNTHKTEIERMDD